MQTLPTSFNQDSFAFNQVTRAGAIAMFTKTKPNHSRPCFEVIKVRVLKPERVFGKDYPEREAMPTNEDWGTLGWSYSDETSARAKFDKLVTEQDRPNSQTGNSPDAS